MIRATYTPNTGVAEPVREPLTGQPLVIAPNPVVGGVATLRIQGVKELRNQVANVRVFDASGRCVYGVQCLPTLRNDGVVALQIDCRRLAAGVYLVRLDAEGFTDVQKLVVQR